MNDTSTSNKVFYKFDQATNHLVTVVQQYHGEGYKDGFFPRGTHYAPRVDRVFNDDWLLYQYHSAGAVNHIEFSYKFMDTDGAVNHKHRVTDLVYFGYKEVPFNIAEAILKLRGNLEGYDKAKDDDDATDKIINMINKIIITILNNHNSLRANRITDELLTEFKRTTIDYDLRYYATILSGEFIKWYMEVPLSESYQAINDGFYVMMPEETYWTTTQKEEYINEND